MGLNRPKPLFWLDIIFIQFNNPILVNKLEELAENLNCDLLVGDNDSPDIVALPHFIAIINRNVLGDEWWNYYLDYLKESGDKNPCIILDNDSEFVSPRLKNLHYIEELTDDAIKWICLKISGEKKKNDRFRFLYKSDLFCYLKLSALNIGCDIQQFFNKFKKSAPKVNI